MNTQNCRLESIDSETLSSMLQFTLPQILFKQVERLGSHKTAIREKAYGIWQAINWSAYFNFTKHTALGLLALGIERGETVALIQDNGPEWLFAELGTQSAGAVPVPLYIDSTAETLAGELNHVQAAYVFAENQTQVDKLLAHHREFSHLKQIIYVDPTGLRLHGDDPRLIAFSQLLELGEDLDEEQPDLFIKELWDGKPEDTAVMLKTSGTTGSPKLAMLSHANFTNAACRWIAMEPIGMEDDWMSMSPMPWIMEQVWGMGIALCGGLTINFPERPETLLEDFIDIGPTIVTGSAGFWKDLISQTFVTMSNSGKLNRALFDMTLHVADQISLLESEEKPASFGLKLKSELLRRFVSRPLLHRIGLNRIRAAYAGGHPINPRVIRFFRRFGLNIKQSYGLTETCGMVHVHPENEVKANTVGKPLPGTEIKLGADRGILVSSQSNFLGYYQDPVLTGRVLEDGWLNTGDAGCLDEDGHLIVIGRKHELMETDDEPVSLDFIETHIKFSPYIEDAVVRTMGDNHLSAVICIDFKNVAQWAKNRAIRCRGYADLAQRPEVAEMIRKEMSEVNGNLPEPLKVSKFVLLKKPFTCDNREITRTGKTRKKIIFDRHRGLFNAMLSRERQSHPELVGPTAMGSAETLDATIRIISV